MILDACSGTQTLGTAAGHARYPGSVGQIAPGVNSVALSPAVCPGRGDCVGLCDPVEGIVREGSTAGRINLIKNLEDIAAVTSRGRIETTRGTAYRNAEMEIVAKAEYRVLA